MAEKSLNMMEKMMEPNITDHHIINSAKPLIITIEKRYQIDFGKPGFKGGLFKNMLFLAYRRAAFI